MKKMKKNKNNSIKAYTDLLRTEGLLVSENVIDQEKPVTDLSFDSRTVCPGTLFVCKGAGFRESYISMAKEKGAAAFISEKKYDVDDLILVNDIRRAMAVLSAEFYDRPWEKFRLVGLTGTKGKSTTLLYVVNIMEHAAVCGKDKFGYISTIDTYDGINRFESHLTTPEAIELGLRLSNIAESGLYAAGMEVSSQALKFDRTYGVKFDIGCFTNFGLDHIGDTEHPDIEDYLQSKLKIFDQCKTAVINLDSDRIDDILSAAKNSRSVEKIITYSSSDRLADYVFSNVRKEGGYTVFDLSGIGEIKLGMPGLFNAENAVCAAIITTLLGASPEEIKTGLIDARAAGRMEVFENKERDIVVISDYAHNALSFERLFSSVKEEYPGYRIEAVFGAAGGKGYSRREDLPRVAAAYADFVWVTEEDPGEEDPAKISEQIYANLVKYGGKGVIDLDRERTITNAIKKAPAKTVVLLIAKGRESYMHRGTEYVPIKSDSELAEELINL